MVFGEVGVDPPKSYPLLSRPSVRTISTMFAKRLPTWREMHPNTTSEEEAVLIMRYRHMTLQEKFAEMERLSREHRAEIVSTLVEYYPQASEPEIRRRLAGTLLGEELATKAYGKLEDIVAAEKR